MKRASLRPCDSRAVSFSGDDGKKADIRDISSAYFRVSEDYVEQPGIFWK